MGCFLGCFGVSKDDKKRLKNSHIAPPPPPNNNIIKKYGPIQESIDTNQEVSVFETRVVKTEEEKLTSTDLGKEEEQLTLGARKKVTFDSNVQAYEHVSSDEAPEILEESEIVADCSKPGQSSSKSDSGSTLSSAGSFPPNHRYENCRESDDDMDDELDCQVSDLDEDELDEDDDDDEGYDAEDSDDDYYSRQVPEISTRSCSSMESGTKNGHESLDREANTPQGIQRGARDRTGYVHSVLNPIENTTQWKNLKAKRAPQLKQQKENSQIDISFQQSSSKPKLILDGPKNSNEVAVDASLSTWLDSTQNTPLTKGIPIRLEPISSAETISSHGSNSVTPQEEGPIVIVEKLKPFPASSSPRRSPSQTPNEKPLVSDKTPVENCGSSSSSSSSSFKGIPNTTSKYREDKRVNWHSTPFETRLERALHRGATDSRT